MRSIRWPIAILVSVATAIAYLDRQTLAVTWPAIQQTIRLSDNDFRAPSVALLPGLCPDVHGRRQAHGRAGLASRLPGDRGLVVAGLRRSGAGPRVPDAGGSPADAGPGSRRNLSGIGQGRRRVVSRSGARHGDGNDQRRQLGRRGCRPARHRAGAVPRLVALGLLSKRRGRAVLDRLVAVGLLPAGRAPATLRRRAQQDRRGAGPCPAPAGGRFLVAAAPHEGHLGIAAGQGLLRRRLVYLYRVAAQVLC